MAKQFFSDWQLWQKLVFVRSSRHSHVSPRHVGQLLTLEQCLACAILITVLLGVWKLFYTHRNLRKFVMLAEEERRDQQEHKKQTEMLKRQTMGSPDEKADVAFGIRAIEKGVKVEGVWISPSSTPRPGSRDPSVDSLICEKKPRQDWNIDIEKQAIRKSRSRSASVSTIGTARTHDRAVSLDRGSIARTSRSPSPDDGPVPRPPRSRHPPSSYVRYSCNPYLLRQSTIINTFEGLEAIHKASTSIHTQNGECNTSSSNSSNRSSNSGNDIETIVAAAPNLFTVQPARPRPRHSSSVDIEMLNKHRTSQAAEVGQLTPRVRREGPSPTRPSTSDTHLDYFGSPHRPKPWGTLDRSPDSLHSSVFELPAEPVRRSSLPDVTPFTQFCQKAPRPNCRPPSADSGYGVGRRNSESMSIYETPPSSPIMPASDGAAALSLQPALTLPSLRASFDIKSEAQVLRGHGSGFEILRPGSLNPKLPPAAITTDSMEKPRSGPPISLHNNSRPQSRRSSSMESRRKLQKKRRSSMSPTSMDSTSSMVSRASRISGIF